MKPNANHPIADSCMDYIVNKFRTCLGGIPQVNKFEQVHIQSHEGPRPNRQIDRTENITYSQLPWRVVNIKNFTIFSCWDFKCNQWRGYNVKHLVIASEYPILEY